VVPFELVPVALALAAAVTSAIKTANKIHARSSLSKAIRSNPNDVAEVKKDLSENNLDAAAALVRKYADMLPSADRNEAEAALAQPSASGRAAYIRKVSAPTIDGVTPPGSADDAGGAGAN
jgi:hypothetical protein